MVSPNIVNRPMSFISRLAMFPWVFLTLRAKVGLVLPLRKKVNALFGILGFGPMFLRVQHKSERRYAQPT